VMITINPPRAVERKVTTMRSVASSLRVLELRELREAALIAHSF
jgi:hypothetical protein